MAYLKVLLFATLGALAGAVLWIVVGFVLPIAAPMLISRFASRGGVGAAGATIGSGSILLAAIIGLVVAGVWAVRRFVLVS